MIGFGLKVEIKPVKPVKTKTKLGREVKHVVNKGIQKLSKICIAYCNIEDGDITMRVPTFELNSYAEEHNEKFPDSVLVLPLTDESLDLKGKIRIFNKEKGEHGTECRIRSVEKANAFPNLSELFIPVCQGWLHSGWVVRQNKQLKFHLREALCPEGFDFDVIHDELDDSRY